MPTTDTKRRQLIAKLREMFQMDQADLDFGIYRIMNAKRDEVERFLEHDLLPTLRTTLEAFQPAGLADKQSALENAIEAAKLAGFDPEQSPKVRQLRDELAETVDLERLEEQVYSDLHTFFSRYCQNGDFMSLRRYKEGVYALPYEGEEVKLHWANADQHYIKSAENFTRYAFKTAQGRVRFELAAATSERDNNKATGDSERRFILAADPLELEAGRTHHPSRIPDHQGHRTQAGRERSGAGREYFTALLRDFEHADGECALVEAWPGGLEGLRRPPCAVPEGHPGLRGRGVQTIGRRGWWSRPT